MKRNEFLKKLGGGAAFALTATCLGGCMGSEATPEALTVDFTIDLTSSTYANLQNNAGYVVVDNQYVVARTTAGEYVAATRTCSHEPRKQIRLRNGEWYCTEHGARFNLSGRGLNSEGGKGLQIFRTSLTNNQLRVFS